MRNSAHTRSQVASLAGRVKLRTRKHVIKNQSFGTVPEGPVDLYTMTNTRGMEVRAMNYGGIIVSLRVPDKKGVLADVVLGFDTLDAYLNNTPYFGAIIGRYANRIANGKFAMENRRRQPFQIPIIGQ